MCPDDIRQLFLDAALAVVGLGDDPDDEDVQQAYMDLIAPGETSARQRVMAKMSGCALVVAGIWRRAGVHHQILDDPYVDQSAVSRLHVIGRDAWIPYQPGLLPGLGDAVRVGDNTIAHGPEHMYTVRGVNGDQAPIIDSVDGGRRNKVKLFEIVEAGQHAWMHGRDTSLGTGHTIMGWYDAVKLAELIPDLAA